jgi:glycosyltransferase involved in cell wall biosynthesis
MKIPLVSAFLEDDVYETRLTDKFMEDVICNEDHFYHRTAKALSNKQIEPVVYYMSQEKLLKKFTHKYGHSIIRIPAKKINFIHEPIVYSPKLIESIKNYDICDFVSGYYIMYKIPDMFDYSVFKLHKKIPIIARWTGGNHKWLFPLRKSIKKASLQRCDKILASSSEEIKVLETVFEIPKENISHLIFPTDFSIFKKRNKNFSAEQISLNPDFRYLLYVGRLVKNKGIKLMLEVFNELQIQYVDIKLIIIGDGPLLEFIKNYIKNHHLEKKILLPGRLTHNVICFYYNVATVLLNIGLSGGVANVIIEALASGLPIINTDVGSSREYVNEERQNGILIRPDDKNELKNAIKNILEKENSFQNWNNDFLNEFSYDEFGNKLSSIYSEVIRK